MESAQARPSIRYLPVSLFGSVMSIAGLSLAWRLASKAYGADIAVSNAIGVVALAVFAVLSLSYLGKLVRHPELVKDEFSHPVIGSFFGTVGISILLLSSVIGAYSADAQLVVWAIGAAVTLALAVVMIARLLNGNAAAASAVPAWLIAGVGSLDIVVTGGTLTAGWTHEVNLLAAAVGGVSAVVFFILIFSRLVHHAPMADGMRPSKMILVAPFAVGFIAYVNLVQQVDMFAALLFYFALFLFVIVCYRLAAKPAPFSPSWWAIGFPMAALSNSALLYSASAGSKGLEWIAVLLLALLTVSVAVLAIRTVHGLATGRILTA
ncbi:C4-dicarboxylate ABC transporter [Massilia sp. Root351]|jgi:tellurite resistance protein|uniref:SLAC1 anion channel family protein n=1 Tax=Massilia sp. Root351 TaxID=1736522 RepID=UPI00070967EE|nr:SLAC1 anion channel family protein [Massilia sp. Root351]KQV85078.1 C4-dicarboxylate ABC transporter [Massilia sp. Root351]